ncbi:MAG: divalent cation tolerance protein CutA [bacterium]|nr:divalent cation tolerance protein CutA [bacterium]
MSSQSPAPSAVFLVLVSCNGAEEATSIGDAALTARHAACFDVLPRTRTRYFWPPRQGTFEEGSGALLMLETLEDHVDHLKVVVRAHHRDELPFVGAIRLEHVDPRFRDWIAGELSAIG